VQECDTEGDTKIVAVVTKIVPRVIIELTGQEQVAMLQQEEDFQEALDLFADECSKYQFDGFTLEVHTTNWSHVANRWQ
jgi:DNA repair ATPase RecN